MKTFEDLDAWKLAHQLVLATYQITRQFPADERFGLTAQSRRAAFSVAANIAEGSARRGPREFRRFLDSSVGSLAELRYAFILARDLNYITLQEWEAIEASRDTVGRVVWGLYNSMACSQTLGPARRSVSPPVRQSV